MRVHSSSKACMSPYTVALLLSLGACSKTGHSVQVTPKDAAVDQPDGSRDAQAADAAADANHGDGAVYSADAAADAATDEDGGVGSRPFDPAQDCQIVAGYSDFSKPVKFGDETGFSVTAGLTGFGVAFQSDSCDAISVLPVASVGDYPQPTVLFDTCSTIAQGVSLLHVSDGYRLSWVDNSAGSAELQTIELPETLKAPASVMRTRVTNNQLRELAPLMANVASTDFLSWIAVDSAAHTRAVMLRPADSSADERALVKADAGYGPTRIALAQLGQDGGALAFVSEQTQPGIWLVPLDSSAEPRKAPILLSSTVSANNTVDIATREEDGGAVIYSVDVGARHEVRFRRLSTDGTFLSDEVKVVTYPLNGRDASLARLGGGYVVAFRSMSDPTATRGEIRLTFVTKEGNLQRDSAGRITTYHVADASTTGGRITARVSRDGQLLIGFLDIDDTNGPQFRLIRKRLDCAL